MYLQVRNVIIFVQFCACDFYAKFVMLQMIWRDFCKQLGRRRCHGGVEARYGVERPRLHDGRAGIPTGRVYMDWQGMKKMMVLALLVVAGWTGHSNAETVVLFPVGPKVQKQIDFWVKIYTQYSREEVVLHDADYPQIIYDVVNVHESFFESLTRWGRRRYLESAKQEYKKILTKFAQAGATINTAGLSEKELFVLNLWANIPDPDKFKKAKDNIHAQAGLRSLYQDGLQRSGRYLTEIKSIFRGYGLPEDLAYLPHVESAFNYRAYSKAGAAGVWQFTNSTGRNYLRINYGIDERYDPLKATDAAARLLRHNYEELGSWPLAITAYNHGANGMMRAKTQLQTSDLDQIVQQYDGRAFGFASKNFYAEFIAAVQVAKNFQRYFGDIAFEQPDSFKVIETPEQMTLDALAKKLKIDKQQIAQLNPALRPPVLRSLRRIPKSYPLRLPVDSQVEETVLLAGTTPAEADEPLSIGSTYIVEAGDNLGAIAASAGTTVEQIMELNDIADPRRIRIGQKLQLPVSGPANTKAPALSSSSTTITTPWPASSAAAPAVATASVPTTSAPAAKAPALAADSTMQLLARARHHASSAGDYGPALSADADSENFVIDFTEPRDDVIIVQPEETVGHLADWLSITPLKLRELNKMGPQANVQVGRKLVVDFSRVSQADFHRKRLQYHRSLQQDYFANYQVRGTRNYIVKNGDSVWQLCTRRFDLPYWLLARYNKEINLLQLQPGVEIKVPIVAPTLENTSAHPEA